MLTRRDFTGLLTTSIASPFLPYPALAPQTPSPSRIPAPRTSVMMWTLNKLGTFEQNLDRVAEAGYTQIELVTEFKTWTDADTSRIINRMHSLGITVDAIAGMRLGFADPAGSDTFLAELQTLIPIVQRFGCGQIILVSGKQVSGKQVSGKGPDQHAVCIETLKRAAPLLAQAGLTALIEPIDRLENPTIYLDSLTEAFAIVKAVDSPAIRVLYDIYHEQRTQGNLLEKFEQNIASVGLIHVADVPGRHQPGTGEINYPGIYRRLAELKYTGTFAMEFYPTGNPVEVLRSSREQLVRSFDPGDAIHYGGQAG